MCKSLYQFLLYLLKICNEWTNIICVHKLLNLSETDQILMSWIVRKSMWIRECKITNQDIFPSLVESEAFL
jgi:hypothetical protein